MDRPKYRMGLGEKIFLGCCAAALVLGGASVPFLLRQRERAKAASERPAVPGTPSSAPVNTTGSPSDPTQEPAKFDEKLWLQQTRAKLDECKRILTSPDLYKDSFDLAASNIDSAKVLNNALCTGSLPAKTPQVEARSSSLVRGFMARLEAELWLRETDPTFKTYAARLDTGLTPEFDEVHLLNAIESLGYGKAVEELNQIRPSEVAESPEASQKWMDLSLRISRNQHLVRLAAPEKLLVYFRLSRDHSLPHLQTEISDEDLLDYNTD